MAEIVSIKNVIKNDFQKYQNEKMVFVLLKGAGEMVTDLSK